MDPNQIFLVGMIGSYLLGVCLGIAIMGIIYLNKLREFEYRIKSLGQ